MYWRPGNFCHSVGKLSAPWARMAVCLTTGIVLLGGASPLCHSQSIQPITHNGRTIFTNEDSPALSSRTRVHASATRTRKEYVYWSSTEKRWIPLAPASPRAMRAARSAAAEVESFVDKQPEKDATQAKAASAKKQSSGEVTNPNYAQLARGRLVTNTELDHVIAEAAERNRVDPNLVRALIKVESNFNPKAVSPKGALGLMQLMPATARDLNVTDALDVRQNVNAGVRHLKGLLQNFGGNIPLSLAAYNAGAGAVTRNNGIPPYAETREYVRRITHLYNGGDLLPKFVSVSAPVAAPVHMGRDARGVLTITNTD